jgi:enterochelin esterase-like enzyme
MLRALLLALAVSILPTAAAAQQSIDQIPEFPAMSGEIRSIAIEGPNPAVRRSVYFWRPANAPPGPLPVLYMADGAYGLYVVVAGLRQAVADGRVPPFLVVSIDPHRQLRHFEYVLYRERRTTFEDHERWFLETVIPFAERVAGASTDPAQRAVGGYSNGADFTLAMIERHPEMFGGALVHSPASKEQIRLDARAAHVRWVMTAGRLEGRNNSVVALLDRLIGEINERPSAIRRCVGDWAHEGEAWRDISPGSVSWLFQFAAAAEVETTIERATCANQAPS